ncbi:MAG: ATP phosphoribosyltransferase regulatory subunit, partial [Solirubrobacterales bacterium]
MAGRAQAPRGTFDVLPADAPARAELEQVAARRFADAGFGRIETPVFEDTGLFARAVGESTDVVSKEMYTFSDQGDRSLTLR